jgi:hypothetical protein
MQAVVEGDVVVTGAVALQVAVVEPGSAPVQRAARWQRTAMTQVPLLAAEAVVDVVRAAAVVDVDVVAAAMTATALPAGSLTGMMALAGAAMRTRSAAEAAVATGELQMAALRLRTRRSSPSRSPLRRQWLTTSLQPVRRLQLRRQLRRSRRLPLSSTRPCLLRRRLS